MRPFIILIFISLFAFSLGSDTLDLTLSSYEINKASVTYTFGLSSGTGVYRTVASGTTFTITFPSDYSSIFPSSFTCDDNKGNLLACTRSGQVITVTNLFNSTTRDYYFTVRVIGLKNPNHSASTGSFTAAIPATTAISASNTATITTGTSTCTITPASYVTGATTSWTFSITTSNAITLSGGLTITPVARWTWQTDNLLPTSTPTCSVTSPTTSTPGSCYVSSSGTLEVRTMTSTEIAAGAVLIITITNFRNPPMTAAYSFTLTTLDSSSRGVDTCTPSITPTTANTLTIDDEFLVCVTNSDLKTVNTYDTCVLTFTITNPLPSGASVAITFPSTVGLSSLTSVISGSTSLSYTGPTSNKVTIGSLVSSYTSAGTAIALRFSLIQQPSTTKPTASFTIATTYSTFSIDALTSGATYSASAGALSSLSVTSSPSTVGSSSASMTFSFVITDALSTSATATIAFPSELTIATASSASCTGSGTSIATGPTCSISSSVLTISSFASAALAASSTITIRLNSAVTLPSSTKPTSSFTITTLDGGYAVDTSTSLAFSATAASIVTGTVSVPDGSLVGGVSTYTFSFINVNAIPSTGQIQIAFPTDDSFAISDSTTIAQGVSVTVGSNSAATVSSTVVSSSSPNTITFTNPTSASIVAGTTITFTVPKIRNPLSTASSSSFTLTTLTSDGYSIDTKTSGLAIVAGTLTATDFYSLTTALSPSTTGSTSTYKFKMSSTIAQASTNIVQITFPSTFTFSSSVTCQVIVSSTSGSVSTCTPSSSNVFTITLGQAVTALTTFEVDIAGVTNPTAATSYTGFLISTMISSGYLVNQRTSGISVTVTPSTITTASLARSTKTLSTAATYTFTFTPVNSYPSTAYIQMTVPSELTLSASPVCTALSGITSIACSVSSTNSNQFTITGASYSSSSISFSVATITNQATQTNSSSFTIYVFTSAGLIIDQLTSGLVSESACSSNCLTCSDTNKNYCLSCPTSGNTLLNVPTHTCVSSCGTGTYLSSDSTQCLACSSSCFTCSGSASTCTSCDTTSTLPSLYNSECRSSCPEGYYADSSTKVCNACSSSSHCKTCSSSTTCLSCNDNYYLLNGACGTSCDDGYYADSSSWSCKACSNHCKTCSSSTVCTGCDTTSSYPIFYNSACLASCPNGYYQSAYSCLSCDSPCATCSGSSTYCLTCTGGLYPDNGECKTCSTSCGTCSGSPTSCASCKDGYYLQGTKCVTSCSDGYYLDSGSATCKACSDKCQTCSALNRCTSCDTSSSYPYFYQGGETCVKTCPSSVPRVVNGVCTESNTVEFINPYDGVYLSGLPFPFIIFGAIFCGLVGVGKIINTNTLVTSNIIGFLGLIEFSTWIAMVILLALSHPGDPVSDFVGLPIVIVAIVTSLILNGFFYWRLVKPQIKSEQYLAWKNAKKSNRISSIVIQTLSIVCFKTFRLVYSRFFGLEFMSADLNEPKAFLKRLHKYTGINFVISVLPALIAAIITLNEDAGDYEQLLRISIEVLVISLVLMLVSIYDGFKSNELDKNETGITAMLHGQVLSMIEKTVIDKLNESMESGKVKRPQSKLSAYRRRNSLNLDQSYEYNEANSSFLNLNRTEKILTGVGMKHEESFNESVDGVIGRDAQGNAIRKVNAIEEIEKDDDEEPTLNMKNRTLGQLRDMLKDRGHDLEPEKIMIENKDGSVIVLRDKSSYMQNATNMKTSPSKSQVSSIRGIDEEGGRARMSKFVSEDEEFQKLTGRKGQPSTGRRIQDKAMELDENGRPKYASPQSNHRVGTQGGKGSDESEEELELHDSYGNLEAKFGNNSVQDSQNHLASLNRGLENLSPIGRMGSRAMDHSPDRTTIHKDLEDDQEEEELEVHSQTPSKTGPRQSGDDNHLRSSPGFPGKPPTGRKGNKSSAKKNPNQQTPGSKNNTKEDFEYMSSDSQLSVEDVHDHFQDDTPSNYDALNQRFDENLYQQQLGQMGRRPDSRATNVSNAQNMSTRSIPKSHLPPVNEVKESHRRSANQPPAQMHNNNYFSDGMEDGDLPPVRGKSIESVGSQKNSTLGNNPNNNGILQRHKNKVVPFATGGNASASERSNSMGKRAMTPQHNINSRTAQTNSSRGFDTHSNSFSQNKKELNQTVKNFHRAADRRGGSKVFDSQRDKSSEREDSRRPGSVDKMKRLEGIYANKVIVPRLNKISSRGSNKVANSRGFIDDDLDNDGLEIHDFGKFESIVNGMKKNPTEDESLNQK